MGRASTKENKNRYQLIREELGLSREKASELLEIISPERLEKIENERSDPHPDEVLLMSQKYRKPSLCNHYCANQCPIGRQYVPEVQVKELSSIVLEMLASLNSVQKQKDRLIEIAADGKTANSLNSVLKGIKQLCVQTNERCLVQILFASEKTVYVNLVHFEIGEGAAAVRKLLCSSLFKSALGNETYGVIYEKVFDFGFTFFAHISHSSVKI